MANIQYAEEFYMSNEALKQFKPTPASIPPREVNYRLRLPEGVPVHIHALNPLAFLLRAAQVYPNKLALVHADVPHPVIYSYGVWAQRIQNFAYALIQAGVKPTDRIAIIAPNIPAVAEAFHGVLGARAVICAINTRLTHGEVAYILEHSESKLIFVTIGRQDSLLHDLVSNDRVAMPHPDYSTIVVRAHHDNIPAHRTGARYQRNGSVHGEMAVESVEEEVLEDTLNQWVVAGLVASCNQGRDPRLQLLVPQVAPARMWRISNKKADIGLIMCSAAICIGSTPLSRTVSPLHLHAFPLRPAGSGRVPTHPRLIFRTLASSPHPLPIGPQVRAELLLTLFSPRLPDSRLVTLASTSHPRGVFLPIDPQVRAEFLLTLFSHRLLELLCRFSLCTFYRPLLRILVSRPCITLSTYSTDTLTSSRIAMSSMQVGTFASTKEDIDMQLLL
ncbi:hypothetical protein NUW54_g1406 [Trametes sanguinea]|uniref:Uncharacterized protein n=1 Tax=Trametes sanguinea TaxID=158606 RepID=A0ACC1Q718_9APHY|nr:hypothetical protein NUW54_g1406 [Trametes sanguinea]